MFSPKLEVGKWKRILRLRNSYYHVFLWKEEARVVLKVGLFENLFKEPAQSILIAKKVETAQMSIT